MNLFRHRRTPPSPRRAVSPHIADLESEMELRMLEIEDEVERMIPEMEASAAELLPEIEAEIARKVAERMRASQIEQERMFRENKMVEQAEEEAARSPYRVIWREDYVPKEDEAPYLKRDADGLPTLRLADAGDRLGIWSPLNGGALINPKGPGLRRCLGLCTSYARGSAHHRGVYRDADLTYGRWVDLLRQPNNPHDPNAVAMCVAGSERPFGFVGKARARAIARRIDAGEAMAGVTIWGPPHGSVDRSTLVLLGSRADHAAMLDAAKP